MASVISAVASYSSPLFTCDDLRKSSFETAFLCKCKVYLQTNYTCISLRPNAVCWYVHCKVYIAIFGAFVQCIFDRGNDPQKLPLPPGRSGPLPNTSSHPSLHPKPQSTIFLQLTGESAHTLHVPQNCPFPYGDQGPHLIHGSLGPPKSTTQTASRSVQPFL